MKPLLGAVSEISTQPKKIKIKIKADYNIWFYDIPWRINLAFGLTLLVLLLLEYQTCSIY